MHEIKDTPKAKRRRSAREDRRAHPDSGSVGRIRDKLVGGLARRRRADIASTPGGFAVHQPGSQNRKKGYGKIPMGDVREHVSVHP